MPKKLHLNVTQNVIDQAETRNPGYCMVAIAMRNQGFSRINVTSEVASGVLDGKRYYYIVPMRVAAKVIQFDVDKTQLKPWTATLSDPVVKPIKKRGPMGPNKKKTAAQKRAEAARRAAAPKKCKRRWKGKQIVQISA